MCKLYIVYMQDFYIILLCVSYLHAYVCGYENVFKYVWGGMSPVHVMHKDINVITSLQQHTPKKYGVMRLCM